MRFSLECRRDKRVTYNIGKQHKDVVHIKRGWINEPRIDRERELCSKMPAEREGWWSSMRKTQNE